MANQAPVRSANDRRIFACLNEICAAANRWRDELLAATAASLAPEAVADAAAAQLRRRGQIGEVIEANLATVRTVFTEDVDQHEWGAGFLTDLVLLWKDVQNLWPRDFTQTSKALAALQECAARLDEMVFLCSSVVFAPRINDCLTNLEVGQPLDIEFVFGDCFPKNPERRKRLLLEVAQERVAIPLGMVDVEHNVVIRVSPPSMRWKSYVNIALVLGVCIAVVMGLPLIGRWVAGWPFTGQRVLVGYGMWLVGAFLHILISALRQQRSALTPAYAVMNDWFLWLHVKERAIQFSILWISLGYILMSALTPDLDWKTALLAGYSADSVTEVFVERFTSISNSVVKTVADGVKAAAPAVVQ